jgi:Zn-dependent peptidase ImmA (M78 family)
MKYTKENTDLLLMMYKGGTTVANLAQYFMVPERSIIAKLSSLGVYQKKQYLNKRGEVPIKKSEHIESIAKLLGVNSEQLESLEKVNKQVLVLLERKLQRP